MVSYPLVLIKWEDIVSSDSNWKESDDALSWSDSESGVVYQVGFKLDEDEHHIILIDSYFPQGDYVGTVTRIPKEVIRETKTLL